MGFGQVGFGKQIARNAPKYKRIVEPFGDSGALAFELSKKKPKEHILNFVNETLFAVMSFIQQIKPADRATLKKLSWIGSQETFDKVVSINATDGPDLFYRFFYLKKFAASQKDKEAPPLFDQLKTSSDASSVLRDLPVLKLSLKNVTLINEDPISVISKYGGADTFLVLLPTTPEDTEKVKGLLNGLSANFFFAKKLKDNLALFDDANTFGGGALVVSMLMSSTIMMSAVEVITNYENKLNNIGEFLGAQGDKSKSPNGKPQKALLSAGSVVRNWNAGGSIALSQKIEKKQSHPERREESPSPVSFALFDDTSKIRSSQTEKTINEVETAWLKLGQKIIQVLSLPKKVKAAAADGKLTQEEIDMLTKMGEEFTAALVSEDATNAPVKTGIERIIDFGLKDAAVTGGFGNPVLVDAARRKFEESVKKLAFNKVKNEGFKILKKNIIDVLSDGTLQGNPPQEIARWLNNQFGGTRFKWSRLVRTEMGDAFSQAKFAEWAEENVRAMTSIISNPSCPICGPKAGTYPAESAPRFPADTHPNCVCDSRPATKGEMETAGLGGLVATSMNFLINPEHEEQKEEEDADG